MEVFNQFTRQKYKNPVSTSPSITQQHFANECDINQIMARVVQGQAAPLQSGSPLFGDFSNITSFQDAQNKILQAQEAFNHLNPLIRRRFGNNPAQLIDFLAVKENREEAIKLGLIEQPQPSPSTPAAGPEGSVTA